MLRPGLLLRDGPLRQRGAALFPALLWAVSFLFLVRSAWLWADDYMYNLRDPVSDQPPARVPAALAVPFVVEAEWADPARDDAGDSAGEGGGSRVAGGDPAGDGAAGAGVQAVAVVNLRERRAGPGSTGVRIGRMLNWENWPAEGEIRAFVIAESCNPR